MVQAILLADSSSPNFLPITLERPKVLFPIVNRPMIDYTLTWLESEGVVDEVFVLCWFHSDQIIDYLNKSGWCSKPNFRVTTIEAPNSLSAGDALRFIHHSNLIRADFILVGGDTVANVSLKKALQVHDDRRKKDSSAALMTMIIQESAPRTYSRQSTLGLNELFMAIDPDTKQLFYYNSYPKVTGEFFDTYKNLQNSLLADKPTLSFYQHKQDCYIDICSPELLRLFAGDFHHTLLRRHFVNDLLVNDITGCKTFTYEIYAEWADKVDNLRSYDLISKTIIQHWRFPLANDVMCAEFSHANELNKQIIASVLGYSGNTQITRSVIGKGTSIGNNTTVSESVIGEYCVIGSGVSIEGCYIWSNITIEDGCKLKYALICYNVRLKSGARLKPGVVLSSNVVIGEQFTVPPFSKVSLVEQPIKQECGELKHVARSSACFHSSPEKVASLSQKSSSQVGAGGAGYIWSFEEDWKHSVAPEPFKEILEMLMLGHVDIPNNIGAWKKDEDNCSIVSEKSSVKIGKDVASRCRVYSGEEFDMSLNDEDSDGFDSDEDGNKNVCADYSDDEDFDALFPW